VTLLKQKRCLAAKVETTVGTAIALSGSDAAFNAYDVMIQPKINFQQREGQGGFGYLSSVPEGYIGEATFKTPLTFDGTNVPTWASVLLPACGFVETSQVFNPVTEAPGSNVKTLTIGCFLDGVFKSIRGAMGNVKFVLPTGKMAYAEWTFSGAWVGPTDVAILTPTYPTSEHSIRASGGASSFNSVALCFENVTIDVGNVLTARECTTTESGIHSFLVTGRNPTITANPEAKLVATRDSYGNMLSRTEGIFTTTLLGSGASTLAFSAPKAQITSISEADRNKLVTDEITWQCNRNGGTVDRELAITFTDG
jgi:hypothetical protein